MKTISFVFRKKNPLFFSIENVFSIIIKETQKQDWSVKIIEAPFYSSGIVKVFRNILALRKKKSTVYHVTGDIHYAVFAFPRRKTVLTVHDCVFVHQATGFKKWVMTKLFLTWPVKYAKTVTTISEDSRREIIEFSKCDPNKVKVIPDPFGSHIRFSSKVFNKSIPRLLFIGSTPNKNLPRVLEAVEGLDCHLEIVGRIPPDQLTTLKAKKISYSVSERLTEEELNAKFDQSDLLLFPTLFEGFGLPIIEAQQAGKPVITSNLGPMNWVAGEGACLVDPYDTGSIREALIKVIENEQYREDLVQKGLSNLNRFSPQNITQQYLTLYNELI